MTSWAKRIAVLLLPLALACNVGPKLTQAHFEQVHEGMTTDEVKALLGEPTHVQEKSIAILGTVTRYTYDEGSSHAELFFRDNRLRAKTGSIAR